MSLVTLIAIRPWKLISLNVLDIIISAFDLLTIVLNTVIVFTDIGVEFSKLL